MLEGPTPIPSVSNDHVVWGQADGPLTGSDRTANAVVRDADLRTGKVRDLARHAGMPFLAWPWICWGVSDGEVQDVLITNQESGQQVRLTALPPTFAIHGNSAAYNSSDYQAAYLINDLGRGTAGQRIVGGTQDDDIEWVSLNDRVVAFTEQSAIEEFWRLPTRVYDRVLGALVDLPMIMGHSATYAAGPLVVWQTPTETVYGVPGLLQVVDTREIP